jgi:membrane fusion protein, multidrug efflux system
MLGTIGCGGHADAESHGHTGELLVTSPLRTDTELSRDYVCQIRASQHIEVRALERGYLEEVFVDEGQTLSEGQPMFQIMPTLHQAELDRAKAEAEAARIEYANTELLAAKEVVSQNELALAKARLDKANAEVALSDAHRRLTAINAPFDGLMGLLEVRRGSLLDEGELLTTLSDNSKMWVYFNVTEAEYLDYEARSDGRPPPKVTLVLANNEVFDHPGAIETIAADFNNETGTIAFRATFPNPTGLLRHGETGNVRLTTTLPSALLIPQQATFEVLDDRFVFVVDDEGVVQQRKITIAEELPHVFVVADGLAETDRILLEGLRKVQNGQAIATKYQAPTEVFAHLDLPAD